MSAVCEPVKEERLGNKNLARKAKLKKELMKGLSYKRAMLNAGFAPSTAHNPHQAKVVQQCKAEIEQDIKKRITVDSVLKGLEHIQKLATEAEDFSTATRCEELKGKWLAMFTDKTEISESEKEDNQFSLQRLARIKNLNGSKN